MNKQYMKAKRYYVNNCSEVPRSVKEGVLKEKNVDFEYNVSGE